MQTAKQKLLKYSYDYPATAIGYAGFASGAVASGG